ncbi:MAG: class I SAM-dependent methyltransferase [Candidatus Abyssubacteria bacterium]
MDIQEFQKLFEEEETYWWFVGKWRLMRQLVDDLQLRKDALILDLGCGCGMGLKNLSHYGKVTGFDREHAALRFCRERHTSSSLVQGDVGHLPFKERGFDVIVALDLLEHIEDDRTLLKELWRMTKQGGKVIVSVPCYPSLYSPHDLALHHKRRYTREELRSKVHAAGFTIKRMTHFNATMCLPIATVRCARKIFGDSGAVPKSDLYLGIPRVVNTLLTKTLAGEAWICRRWSLPFGLSLYAVLVKSD